MNRILATLLSAAAVSAVAMAQCPQGSPAGLVKWSSTAGYAAPQALDDESITNPPVTLSPAFVMPGAVGNLDRLWINSNGELYLTDSSLGLAQPASGALFGVNTLAEMRGDVAGASARIAVLGGDHQGSIATGATWQVSVDQSVVDQTTVSWVDVRRFANTTGDRFSFQATLFHSSGVVTMNYGSTFPAPASFTARWAGISIGNGVGSTTTPSSDLSTSPDSGTLGLLYENFGSAFDLAGQTLTLIPNGTGGYTALPLVPYTSPSCASHVAYGAGCYGPEAKESFLQLWTTSALAGATLQGNAMIMTPTVNGYTASWIPGGAALYVAPSGGATLLPVGDDVNQTVTPSIPFPSPNGAASQLNVQHNGFVTLGNTPAHAGLAFNGTAALIASSTLAAFYNWFDFNDAETGSGRIKTEEIGGIYYITWEGVQGFETAPFINNPHTFQFQFDLNTGNVAMVWVTIDANSFAGRNWLVGYSDAGVSQLTASIDLPTALPLTTGPDVVLSPLTLSASPRPVYTVGNPTAPITYTINNVPEIAPGLGITILFFSVAPIPSGIDLGPAGIDVGMPGCNLYIASLDVTINTPNTAPTTSAVLSIPQPLSPGLSFYSQALSLFVPNSLPNGQNPFGGLMSNGLTSTFNIF